MKSNAIQTLPGSPVEKIVGIGGPKIGSFVFVVRLTDGKTIQLTIAPGSPLEIVDCSNVQPPLKKGQP